LLASPHLVFFEDASVGTNTTQAMRIGVVRGIDGALKELVDRIIEKDFHSENPLVFITGDDAAIVRKALENWRFEPVHEPNLVLYGASALMAQWMQEVALGKYPESELAGGFAQLQE
jgi:pantothenate kinase type III